MEEFVWSVDGEPQGEIVQRNRTAQFGDGFAQVGGDGINEESQSWPLTFGGTEDEVKPIADFLRRHKGQRAFAWTPPLGELGLYRSNGFGIQPKPGNIFIITVTFEQAFHP